MDKLEMNRFIIKKTDLLPSVMQKIDDNCNGIVFVVDDEYKLCGSVTDGDIRRWILKTGSIDTEVFVLMNKEPRYLYEEEKAQAVEYLKKNDIKALPVLNKDGYIADIILAKISAKQSESEVKKLQEVSAVIMAGGKGSRLYPYTKILPKPLIPIGEIPIVERVMNTFTEYGVTDFWMTVNYKKNMIQSYFADVKKKYSIQYVEEEIPLGTGGGIKLISKKFDKPLFIANCDSLIRADYTKLYQYHIEMNHAITIVTALKNDVIPYGVIYSKEDGVFDRMVEKPTLSYMINTGMYIINPEMIDYIPENEMFHMTHLVEKAVEAGYKVGLYPISEDSFLDMGEFAEMKRMEEKLRIQ